jgi:hypothetical protein
LNQCKTVAIETGIQNVGVAFLIIFTNLPSPEADFAAMPVIAVAALTNAPLFLVYFFVKIYTCIKARRDRKNTNKPGLKRETNSNEPNKNDEDRPMILTKLESIDGTPAIVI